MTLFQQRLDKLGFKTYNEYLKSDYWKKAKQRYSETNRLKECLICGNKRYILHHQSYVRLGSERPSDFIPLCQKHHEELHIFLKSHNGRLDCSRKYIRKYYHIGRREISMKLSGDKRGANKLLARQLHQDRVSKKQKKKRKRQERKRKIQDKNQQLELRIAELERKISLIMFKLNINRIEIKKPQQSLKKELNQATQKKAKELIDKSLIRVK